MALLGCVQVVDGYLGTVISQTVTFAADEFGRGDTAQGVTLAVVRLGVLVSLGVVMLADRQGRRKLLLNAASAAIICTALGSIAPNLWFLGGSQLFARGLTTGLGILIGVYAAEELPKGSRAYGLSLLALAAALGAGVAVWILPVADLHEGGWRLLYLVPILSLPGLVFVGRRLPETRRYAAKQLAKRESNDSSIDLSKLALLAMVAFLFLIFAAPASQFQNDFLKDHRGFTASGISLYTVLTTTPAGIGIFFAGRLADTRGRRSVGSLGLLCGTIFIVLSYHTAGIVMWSTHLVGVVSGSLSVALGVYGPELFSTQHRAKANGLIVTLGVAGSAIGLIMVGFLADHFGSYGNAFSIAAVGPLLAAALVMWKFPETAKTELEDLNPGDVRLN